MPRAPHVLLATAFSLGLLHCGAAAPAPQPPAGASSAPPAASAAPIPHPLQAPNVEALKAALIAEGYKVQISAHKDGRVGIIKFVTKVPTTKLPHELFIAIMKAHGDSLGYGTLGDVELGGSSGLSGPVGSMVGNFPKAAACPKLTYEAAFEELDAPNRAPLMWSFACPDVAEDMATFGQVRAIIERISDARRTHAPEVTDPFATWLRSESIPIDKVTRTPDGVRANPSDAQPLVGDRYAGVKAFAERAAKSEGLPPLDTVDLAPFPNVAANSQVLKTTFAALTLRLAKPPLDGPCIDPRVEVKVFDAVVGPPGVRIVGVQVDCGKEPVEGSKAPPDAGRTLPRAAAGSLPFVAICESVNFAWGYQHSGRVIDKRGDVYTFSGGRPFSGKSAQELAVLIRHGKHYEGTLLPADVDRLISLAAQVERERFEKHQVQVADAPGGGCSLLRAGPSADGLVQIPFNEFGTTVGKRVGSASTEAEKLLTTARALGRP
jgi:hypothetical protein